MIFKEERYFFHYVDFKVILRNDFFYAFCTILFAESAKANYIYIREDKNSSAVFENHRNIRRKDFIIMFKMLKVGLFFAVCVSCLGVSGAGWFVRGNKYNVETLVVTGNYKSPRLMADLIQAESRQPYLIVPAANSKETLCYLAMPKSGIAVREDQFGSVVSFTGCRRVVILGDDNCVPEKYETMIDKNIPVVRITGDWERVAEELTFMLNLSDLKRNYPKLRRKLNVNYQPVSAPAAKAAADGKAVVPAAAADKK